MLELLADPKNGIIKGGIFAPCRPLQNSGLFPEVRELSKLLVLQERSFQSVVMTEGDQCDGLYILQVGSLQASVIDRNGKDLLTKQFERSSLLGEVSFFLETRRTATVSCLSNCRLFFLDIRYKKTLLQLCPLLFRQMRH